MQPKIYLSYSWSPESLAIADTIDKDWEAVGIKLIRDIRDVGYKDSLRTFMQGMRSGDFVLVVISEGYLKSKNCMFEALELFQDPAFKDKILPIMAKSANIHSAMGRLDYIAHWEEERDKLNEKLKKLGGLANLKGILAELDHYARIRDSIDGFSGALTDMRGADWPRIKDQNYEEIFKHIGFTKDGAVQELIRINKITNSEERELASEALYTQQPNNPYVLLFKANEAVEEKKYAKAKFYFETLLTIDPSFVQGHNNFALFLTEQVQEHDKAKEHFIQALALDPNSIRVLVNYGKFLRQIAKNSALAKEQYLKALAINPNDSTANFNLAILLKNDEQDYPGARQCYEKAIAASPEYPDAYYNLAGLLREHFAEYELAREYGTKAVELRSTDSRFLVNLARLLVEYFEDYEQAHKYYEQALEADPDNSVTHFNYGTFLHKHLKEYLPAIEHFRRVIELDPVHALAHSNLTYSLLRIGEVEEAGMHYQTAVALDPSLRDEDMDRFFG